MKFKKLNAKIDEFSKLVNSYGFEKQSHWAIAVATFAIPAVSSFVDQVFRHSYANISESIESTKNALDNYINSWFSSKNTIKSNEKTFYEFKKSLDELDNSSKDLLNSKSNDKNYSNLFIKFQLDAESCMNIAIKISQIIDSNKDWMDGLAGTFQMFIGPSLRTNLQDLQLKIVDLQNEIAKIKNEIEKSIPEIIQDESSKEKDENEDEINEEEESLSF